MSPITSLYQIARRPLLTLAVATTCAAVAGTALAADPGRIDTRSALAERVLFDAGQPGESFDGFIVYYRDDAPAGEEKSAAASRTRKAIDADLARMGKAFGFAARHERQLATGGHLVRLNGTRLAGEDANAWMATLAANPDIVAVEPNARAYPALVPNDRHYALQWGLSDPVGGISAPAAWDMSTGSGIVIAVVDTGGTPHPDLDAQTVAGYDFISSEETARDGDGRDANPNDEGDWHETGDCGPGAEPSKKSSWHGTHVAGIAAAQANNGIGVAGVAFNARVQHVRALGRCGGTVADIADSIIWAAGGTVPGVPANATPARVINLSLGGEGMCGPTYQNAVDAANARKAVVIAAAGNDDAHAATQRPANCSGVLVVGASNRAGIRASYSNYGELVDLAAPGGDCRDCENDYPDLILSTLNSGEQGQNEAGYYYMAGTSMATPHVSGVAALVLARKGSLSPAEVRTLLRDTAKPFPGHCTGGCGVGLVNAEAAVRAAGNQAITRLPISVTRAGIGSGRITSSPSGIDCGARCSNTFSKGTSVTLTAAAATGSTFTGWSGACSGSGSTCTLAANQAHAALAHFKVPVTGLSRGQAIADLSAQGGLARMYSLHVPSGSESLRIRLSGGSGDADLYVRHGTEPNESQYDCRPYLHGNNELCEFPAPLAGIYYIMIKGAPDYSGARLFAHYALGPQGGRTVSADVPMTGISAPQGGGRYFKVDVPQGATDLWITTRASRDLDLFVRRGGVPTPDWNEQFVSGNPAGNEEIYIPNPQRGMHYILLHAYESFSGASLRAGYTVAGKRIVMTHSGLGAGTVAMRRVATGATAATCAGFPCTVGLPDATFDLIASPSTGSAFSGWIASQCDSITPQGDCRMRVSSERPVSVGFSGAPSKPVVTLNTVGEGSGVVLVRAAGGDAPLAVCTAFPCRIAPTATTYELVPIAAPDSAFTRWISPTMGTPACASITAEGYCRLQPTAATSVTANFVK